MYGVIPIPKAIKTKGLETSLGKVKNPAIGPTSTSVPSGSSLRVLLKPVSLILVVIEIIPFSLGEFKIVK